MKRPHFRDGQKIEARDRDWRWVAADRVGVLRNMMTLKCEDQ